MQIDQNGYHDPDRLDHESDTNNYSPADPVPSANGMDVDDEPATPSPEPILTLNIGESKGTHIDQPTDLADKTSIHSLSSPNQVIMHLAFNPQDPTILATGGEALARIWQTAKTAGPLEASQPYRDILPPSDDSYVSAEAWSPNGEVLAIASRNATTSQLAGAVSLWTNQGKCIEELPATQELIFKLRWNPAGTHLLGVTSSGLASTSVVVWEAGSPPLSQPCEVQKELRDVIWTSDTQFAVCGNGIMATSGTSTAGAILLQPSADPEVHNRTWTHILQDSSFSTNFIAADESGSIALIGRQGDLQSTRDAHDGELTGLELRPSSNPGAAGADSTRLLATSGMEGTVKLWNASNLENLATLSFGGPASPVMSLSFTPTGHLLAAGNPNRIYVWNPDHMGPPKATWKRETGKGPQKKSTLPNGNMNGFNGHNETAMDYDSAIGDDAEDEGRSLSWDAEGRKLAMGVGSQVRLLHSPFAATKGLVYTNMNRSVRRCRFWTLTWGEKGDESSDECIYRTALGWGGEGCLEAAS